MIDHLDPFQRSMYEPPTAMQFDALVQAMALPAPPPSAIDHSEPFQCSMMVPTIGPSVSPMTVPTAMQFEAPVQATEFSCDFAESANSAVVEGLFMTDHLAPFQCSTRGWPVSVKLVELA
jgi:hypothetical protein